MFTVESDSAYLHQWLKYDSLVLLVDDNTEVSLQEREISDSTREFEVGPVGRATGIEVCESVDVRSGGRLSILGDIGRFAIEMFKETPPTGDGIEEPAAVS